jgi:hypothetical protein
MSFRFFLINHAIANAFCRCFQSESKSTRAQNHDTRAAMADTKRGV